MANYPLVYVKSTRGRNMPFVKVGMRVEHRGRKGKITGGNRSGNLQIKLDGDSYTQNCHPKWAMRYFDKEGKVIAEYPE